MSQADLKVRLYGRFCRAALKIPANGWTVSCIYEPAIADYVDEALDERARETFESHLAECEQCPGIVRDFRAIRTAAATLERRAVPPQLWRRIAAAIESEGHARPRWPWMVMPPLGLWKPLAAGAFVLLLAAVTWSVTWSGWRQFEAARGPAIALETTTTVTELPESVEAELTVAAEHYQKAIAGLEQIRATPGAELDMATSEILQTNLSVIDQAISESRAALTTSRPACPRRKVCSRRCAARSPCCRTRSRSSTRCATTTRKASPPD